jgi:AcrR family transcriptional regulator
MNEVPNLPTTSGAGRDPNPGSEPNTASTDTADALVQAARRLFAQHGFEGASVRAITAEAGANLGAITYHFGSKRALYDRVLESFVGPLASRALGALDGPGDVFERIEAVIRVYFDYLAAHPEAPHLMMQELVLSGGEVSEVVLRQIRRVHAGLSGLIQEGQRAGVIRPGNPAVMPMSIIAQPVFMMLMRQPLRAVTNRDLGDPAVREEFVANVIAFVRGGLAMHSGGAT